MLFKTLLMMPLIAFVFASFANATPSLNKAKLMSLTNPGGYVTDEPSKNTSADPASPKASIISGANKTGPSQGTNTNNNNNNNNPKPNASNSATNSSSSSASSSGGAVSLPNSAPTKFDGVTESKINGVVCPLVDGTAAGDLVAAAENLANKMERIKKCDGNADGQSLSSGITALVTAGKNLSTFPKDYEELIKSADLLNNYETQVSNAVAALDTVGKSISSTGFISSECGRKLVNDTDILFSISKAIQSLAPYALTAVQAVVS